MPAPEIAVPLPPASPGTSVCDDAAQKVDAFIDAFVDYSVAGIFFPQTDAPQPSAPPTRHPAPARLVAVGDLHGDFSKSIRAFSLAGVVDPRSHRWTGGDDVVVQVGDLLDRGHDEIRLLYRLHRLKQEAAAAGGALITILGNHEIMNMESDFRYVDPYSLAEFQNWARWYQVGSAMKSLCPPLPTPPDIFAGVPDNLPGVRPEFQDGLRARIAALRPGGPLSKRFLSDNPTVVVVGDSVFVHGGLLERHALYGLDRINNEVREWIRGTTGQTKGPDYIRGRDSLVWLRRFSEEAEEKCDCVGLAAALSAVPGAARMVVGHTIQRQGINTVCDNRAVRIDVGLSKGCSNGLPEVLEINGRTNEVVILTSNPVYMDCPANEARIVDKEMVGLAAALLPGIPKIGVKA